MDIEKLIEQLSARGLSNGSSLGYHSGLFEEAATALSTLQDEKEKLYEKIEDARLEGYAKGLGEMSSENEKLRAELERVKRELEEAVEHLRGQCRYCKRNLVCTSRKGPHSNCWEWRGRKED